MIITYYFYDKHIEDHISEEVKDDFKGDKKGVDSKLMKHQNHTRVSHNQAGDTLREVVAASNLPLKEDGDAAFAARISGTGDQSGGVVDATSWRRREQRQRRKRELQGEKRE